MKTFSVGFAEDGERQRARRRARRSRAALGADHHELELSLRDDRDRPRGARLGPRRAASPTSRRSASWRSASSPRSTSRSRSPGRAPTSCFGGLLAHRRAALVDAEPARPRRRCGAAALASAAGAAARAVRGALARGGDPVERATSPCSAPISTSTLAARARPRRRSRADGERRCARSRATPPALDGGPLAAPLLPRRPARARRRHAPLLRPRVDGALARGARAVPRPPSSSSSAAAIPTALKVRRRHDEVPASSGSRAASSPTRIIDKPKIGFFNRAVDGWLEAQLRRRAADFLLADRAALRRVPRPRTRVRRLVADGVQEAGARRRAPTRSSMLEVWLSSFAAARAPRPGERSRRRARRDRPLTYAVVTPARERGDEPRAARRQHGRADVPPREWLIVDNGSDRRDAGGRRRARRASSPCRATISCRRAPSARDAARRSSRPSRRARDALDRARRHHRQARRRHLLRRRLLRAARARVRGGPAARHRRAAPATSKTRGEWRPHVRDARPRAGRHARLPRARASRRCCRSSERMGWDGIDELKAQVAGWSTRTLARRAVPAPPAARQRARDVVEVGRPGRHGALHGLPLRLPPRSVRGYRSAERAGRGRDGVGLPRRASPGRARPATQTTTSPARLRAPSRASRGAATARSRSRRFGRSRSGCARAGRAHRG